MTAIWLHKQLIIPYLSHPLLTFSFVLRPMIFLTVNAAISNEVAAAFLQFDVIHFRFAARSTAHPVVCRFIHLG
jgi:hypothetical protein